MREADSDRIKYSLKLFHKFSRLKQWSVVQLLRMK